MENSSIKNGFVSTWILFPQIRRSTISATNQFHKYLIKNIQFLKWNLHLTYIPSVSMHFIMLLLNLIQNIPTYIN